MSNESTTTQVWRWAKEQGNGATFITKEIAKRLPHLQEGRLSAACAGLVKHGILKRKAVKGRCILWEVVGANKLILIRNEPKAHNRNREPGAHRVVVRPSAVREPAAITDEIVKLLCELQERSTLQQYTTVELLAELTRRQQ